MTGPLTRRIAERKLRQRVIAADKECREFYGEASTLERKAFGQRDDRPEWLRRLTSKDFTGTAA